VGDWLPDSRPSWWGTAKEFFSDPESQIREWIAGWLVAGYLAFYTSFLEVFQTPFNVIKGATQTLFGAYGRVIRRMGLAYAGALDIIGGALELIATAGGPFGFVIGFVMFAGFIIALSWGLKALIRVIPVL